MMDSKEKSMYCYAMVTFFLLFSINLVAKTLYFSSSVMCI